MSIHQWSGAPGVYCVNCFNESPLEDAINCPICVWHEGMYGMEHHEPCDMHKDWDNVLATGCPPDPEKVTQFKTKWSLK